MCAVWVPMPFLRRLALMPVLAIAVAVLGAGPALAADYCVLPATGCTGPNTFPATGAGVQSALNAAHGASDRVRLGAATYTAPTTSGFSYNSTGSAVEIVGAGSGQTILTGPDDTVDVLYLAPSAAGLIHDVGIRMPKRSVAPGFLTALHLLHGTARRVAITSDPALNGANALDLADSTFEDGVISLPLTGPIAAIGTVGQGATVRNTTVVAARPINITDDDATIERVRAIAGSGNAVSVRGLNARISDSLIVQPGSSAAVYVSTGNSSSPTLRLDHDTIVGTSGATNGLFADGSNTGFSATITASDTIITGFTHARTRYVAGAATAATVTTSYSDYDPAGDQTLGTVAASGGSFSPFPGTGDVDVAPGFVDAAGGDYRLGAGSPLIDAGDPAAPANGEPAIDLAGVGRSLDGTRDCLARTDIGAYERHDGPTARATSSATPMAGAAITFDASGSCDPDGDALSYAWTFDDGATADGPVVVHAFAGAGAHTATVTTTDPHGESDTTTLSFTVAPAAVTPSPGDGGGGTPPDAVVAAVDRVAPTLTGLRAAPPAFAVRVGARRGRKAHGGTTLRFVLSEPARVTLALQREVAGHRKGKRCVAGASGGHAAKGARCTALRAAGAIVLAGQAGANAVAFTGRIGKRALSPGRYRATATAVDAAGNRTPVPVKLVLRVKPAR